MDQANNTITVRISGKNLNGESFQEIATLEQFGNFGVLIHTAQPLRLSDRVHICGQNGEPLASAEVVWVRPGELPAVEALLHRNLEASENAKPEPSSLSSAASHNSSTTAGNLPSATTAGSPSLTKGTATGNLSKNLDAPTERELSISGVIKTDRYQTQIPTTSTKRLSRDRRDEIVEPRQTKQSAQAAAQNLALIATLQQHGKMALTALVVLAIFFVTVIVTTESSLPTTVEILEQDGCLEAGSIKDSAGEGAGGDLECWAQSNNGAVQFIRRDEVALSQAVIDISNLRRDGMTPHGYWCPKGKGRLVENPSVGNLPAALNSVWSLKPIGANATALGELTMQMKDSQLLFKEATKQSLLDRTQEINKVIYYAGLHKFVVKLNDNNGASANTPVLKELIFYLPKGQETNTVAEGELTNSTYQIYVAQSSEPQGGFSFSFRQIILSLLGLAMIVNLIYLSINFSRIRKLTTAVK
jgi:hypothetical protein